MSVVTSPSADKPEPFAFYTRASVFEDLQKSDAKRQMRIGGPMGSDGWDLAKEQVLQDGLNYDDLFSLRGFFNKNHSQDTLDILGYPEKVTSFAAGETMPDGTIAKHNTTWVEGYLFDTAKGRETYELAKAMQGSGRSLGFSVEGHVEQRTGPGNRVIAKARIKNVAITHIPCNPDARLEVLYRSLTIGNAPALAEAAATPIGQEPATKPENGMILSREDLDRRITEVVQQLAQNALNKARKPIRPQLRPCLAKNSPSSWALLQSVYSVMPDASAAYAADLVRTMHANQKA